MAPPPKRYRIRKSNNLGINLSPKAKKLFRTESCMGDNKHDKCIKKYYPFIYWKSNRPYVEVHVWNSIFNIEADLYKMIYSMRHPSTFYRRELHVKSIPSNNDNYLYGPLKTKRYRTVSDFENKHVPYSGL